MYWRLHITLQWFGLTFRYTANISRKIIHHNKHKNSVQLIASIQIESWRFKILAWWSIWLDWYIYQNRALMFMMLNEILNLYQFDFATDQTLHKIYDHYTARNHCQITRDSQVVATEVACYQGTAVTVLRPWWRLNVHLTVLRWSANDI